MLTTNNLMIFNQKDAEMALELAFNFDAQDSREFAELLIPEFQDVCDELAYYDERHEEWECIADSYASALRDVCNLLDDVLDGCKISQKVRGLIEECVKIINEEV